MKIENLLSLSFVSSAYNDYFLDENDNVWTTQGSTEPRRVARRGVQCFVSQALYPYNLSQIKSAYADVIYEWKCKQKVIRELLEKQSSLFDSLTTKDKNNSKKEYIIGCVDNDGSIIIGLNPTIYTSVQGVENEIARRINISPSKTFTYFKRMKTAKSNGISWD